MSLVWHIARKDLFRLRVILLLWAAVITGRMAFALIQSRVDTAAAIGFIVPAWIFGSLFLPLLGVGLVMGALADDAVCDSDAFWITRPISGGQLLAAKLVVLALLSLVPAVLIAPWWLAQGYDAGLLAAAFVHTIKWQLIVTALAAPVATLSRSNGRFVTNAILAGVAAVGLVLIHNSFAGNQGPANYVASYARYLRFGLVLWVAVTAAILFNQFLTRHTCRSWAIAAAALLLGFALAAFVGSHPVGSITADVSPEVSVSQPARVIVSVVPALGANAYCAGHGIRVTGFIPNDPRGAIITVSESMPDFSDPLWTGSSSPSADFKNFLFDHVSKSERRPFAHEAYFLVHRQDGRSVRGIAAPVGEKLIAATLSYFRYDATFSAPPDWTPEQARDFPSWVAGADLVKVGADGVLQTFPRTLGSAERPLRP